MSNEEFVANLRAKYGYSDDMISLLDKVIPALITYYGEDKRNIILGALNDCEIHIQKENEDSNDYLNQYFGINKKWDIPFLGGAFQHTELSVKDNKVSSKSIIFIKTEYLHMYKPFDFTDDSEISIIIHEMCHAIKSYGKLKVENGQVITQSGLITDKYTYHPNTNSFEEPISTNTGFEEALNSYDEAEVMTIMTGVPHEFGGYKGMTQVARLLMQHSELAKVIRTSQFTGGNEWQEFLGKDNSEFLVQNFEDWVNVLYSSLSDLLNDKLGLMEKMKTAMNNVIEFAKNYSSPREITDFETARNLADKKTVEIVNQIIQYNHQTDSFEQLKQTTGKVL